MLCEAIHAYVFQGVVRVLLINAAPFNREPAVEVIKRVEGKYQAVKVILYDINTIINGRDAGFDRDDTLMLSLLAYLRPDMYRGCVDDKRKNINADKYRAWKKRGRDPEKLRKLFPEGLLLPPKSDVINITPDQGKGYFDEIVESIRKGVQSARESIPPPPDGGKAQGL
jgi:hypothetical protein